MYDALCQDYPGRVKTKWPPFIIMKFSHSPYVRQRKMCLSCEPEAMTSPVGLNLQVNTSPACPVRSMIGARRADVLAGPCMHTCG